MNNEIAGCPPCGDFMTLFKWFIFSTVHMMFNVPTCGVGNNFNNFKHDNMMSLGSPSTFSYFLVLNICKDFNS